MECRKWEADWEPLLVLVVLVGFVSQKKQKDNQPQQFLPRQRLPK